MVALAVMGTVMAALTPFLISSLAVVGQQRTRQVAIQVADEAIEQVRSLRGASLLSGRSQSKVTAQWNSAPTAVQPYLAVMQLSWDPLLADPASTQGDQAPLPTKAQTVSIGRMTYLRSWYVGRCRQQAGAANGACLDPDVADPDPDAADLPMLRIVVAVTWTHSLCAGNQCTFVASTLASAANDPVFNINRPPPQVTNPGTLTAYRTQAVSKQLLASGGLLPLTWTASGLPAGLSMSSTGLVTGAPSTLGTSAVTVTAKDRSGASDTDSFSWTVVTPIIVTNPGNQVGRVGVAASVPVTGSGGVAPLTFAAANLPAGLSINTATGTIAGTPTTAQTTTVTVTAVDSKGKAESVTLNWQVLPPVTITDPGPQDAVMSGSVNLPLTATGGIGPYTWRADDLPTGLALNAATGQVSGTVTGGTRFLTTFYAADSAGAEDPLTVAFTIAASTGGDLRVTSPTAATADRTTTLGQAVSLGVAAAGGLGPGYTWSAPGLPLGLTVLGAGATATISGTPTTKGTYTVKLGVRDGNAKSAYLMFIWQVQ